MNEDDGFGVGVMIRGANDEVVIMYNRKIEKSTFKN